VPFFPDDDYQCGPAALAEALSFAGAPRTPAELVDQVYVPRLKGSLQAEMLAATRRAGLVAYPLRPETGALMKELAAGHAVVVLQNLLFDLWPRWHYAVAVGYDLDRGEVLLRSGTHERLATERSAFERSWNKAGRWAFVAVPEGTLPATAEEAAYVTAAAALERVSAARADEAYRLALGRWPGDLVARIGAGNVAYARHDLAAAEAQYRLAAQEHAESGDAWNNLAQVLHEEGHDEEALGDAERAIAIGGARVKDYEATLGEIRKTRAP
jgi:tetratricopeptide (TPR) repeat protein